MAATGRDDVRSALARVELLAGLDDDVLDRLVALVRRRSWPAGATVMAQGTPGDGLLVLVHGSVTVYRDTGNGARAALAHLRPPAALGELTLLDGAPRTVSVEAVEAVDALQLQREDLLEVLHSSPALLDGLLRTLGALVRRLTDQTADHLLLDLTGRVAKTLVQLCGPGPGPHLVELSQSRIAELAGGSRQSLNQVLRSFSGRGIVRVEGRSLVVEDVAALRRRAGLPDPPPAVRR